MRYASPSPARPLSPGTSAVDCSPLSAAVDAATAAGVAALDAPLAADVEGAARPFSHWVRTSPSAAQVAVDGAAETDEQAPSSVRGRLRELYPSDTDVRAGLGWALLKAGRPQEATHEFQELLGINPRLTTAREGLQLANTAH